MRQSWTEFCTCMAALVIISLFVIVPPIQHGAAYAADALSPIERVARQNQGGSVKSARDAAINARAAAKSAAASAKSAKEAVEQVRKLKKAVEALIREGGPRAKQRRNGKIVQRPQQLSGPVPAIATGFQPAQWNEGSAPRAGATRDYFERAAALRWRKRLGDWRDAKDILHGNTPYSVASIKDLDKEQIIIWDITMLVRGWLKGKYQNTGVFLKPLAKKPSGTIKFYSREHQEKSKSPELRVSYSNSPRQFLSPIADTFLDSSTFKSLGRYNVLKTPTLIRFDIIALRGLGPFLKAELVLHTTSRQYGSAAIGVFRPAPELPAAPRAASRGIAGRYPNDKGIMADKEVIFADQFESRRWSNSWSALQKTKSYRLVHKDTVRNFAPLSGKALRVVIRQGKRLGLNLRYRFAQEIGKEPEAAYFRYYLRLSQDWHPTLQGGKLPGFAGTYNVAGWGGRRSNGSNGWSTRSQFSVVVPKGSLLQGRTPIGTYAYHAEMKSKYGDSWMWTNGGLGALKINKWYCIEQYVKLNNIGARNGIFKAWIDGRLAYEKEKIRYRTSPKLKIEDVWMNVYHGGTVNAPRDYHLYIDNVVIAKSYIGPIKR